MGSWESWRWGLKEGIFLSMKGIPRSEVGGGGVQEKGWHQRVLLSFPRPQVYPPHSHSIPSFQALPREESINVLPAFQE